MAEGSAERIRAFIAIRLGAEVDSAIAAFQTRLRRSVQGVAWTDPENFHLTLRFLGSQVTADSLQTISEGLSEGLAAIARATAAFEIEVRAAGAFPSLNRPRVIWVGLQSGELKGLAARVEALAIEAGLPAEERPFSPHLTLGRVRVPVRSPALRRELEEAGKLAFGVSTVRELILFQSRLSPHGAKYLALGSYALAPQAAC